MSLLRKTADWFIDGKRYAGTFHPEPRAVPATAEEYLAWVHNPPPTQKSLDEMLAVVTRVRIVDAGMDRLTGESLDGRLIADVTAPAQVAALRAGLAIVDDPELAAVHCRCLGSPTLELFTDDTQRAGVGLHHGESIRWNRWDEDAPLADPPTLLQVLADLGADGPLGEFQQAHGPASGLAGRIAGTNWVDLKLWQPSRTWASIVGPAALRLARNPGDVAAWAQLAMMLGDSGAPDLGLIVCLHAGRLRASETDCGRVRAHLNLCLMQVGLARPKDSELIPAMSLDRSDWFVVFEARLEAWIARQLAVFDGDLRRAADFVLDLALARTGLRKDEPDLLAPN
jgi:hypothetical protein